MSTTIALAGKGGVGKTTVAAMLIKFLAENQSGSILAIDADPSSNLNMVLGLDLEWTVGDIREGMLEQVKAALGNGGAAMGTMPGGVSKRDYLDTSARRWRLPADPIAMGRSGARLLLRGKPQFAMIDALSRHYPFVVIDNEAGMEHLARRTTRDVQHLLVVSDPTQRGLVAAQRIAAMRNDLDINIENAYLIVNNLRGTMPPELEVMVEQVPVPLLGTIPADDALARFEFSGRPLVDLGDESPVYCAVAQMMREILLH
jgi:CO dehydrogenase maturation factor